MIAYTNYLLKRFYESSNIRLHRFAQKTIFGQRQSEITDKNFIDLESTGINVVVNKKIPKLAWLCEITKDQYTFFIGHMVEHSNNYIFEGAWNGSFKQADFDRTEFVFGSGARLRKNKIIFVPPKHGLESIFVLYDKKLDKYYVSNTICFVLAQSALTINDKFYKKTAKVLYETGRVATEIGVDRYNRILVEDKNYKLLRMTYYNFSVGKSGNIKLYNTAIGKHFESYAEYKKLLLSTAKKVMQNATDKTRKTKYTAISSISKGYDSVAVTSLVTSLGLKSALTLSGTVYNYNDSGEEIAKKLGLKAFTFRHMLAKNIKNLNTDFHKRKKKQALEFIATEGLGDDVGFLPFEPKLGNKLYFSGAYGDIVWGKNKKLLPGFIKPKSFAKSLTEFRLRVGFVHIPLIAVGSRYAAPLAKISFGKDMKPYSIGGDYDRPIPRRIAEEAGVTRESFGIQKSASSPLITNRADIFDESITCITKRYKI